MFISRSAATAVATHNVLTTGVHGVAAKYLAISSGNDQLITNADVKAAAGIVYSKLALDGNVKNADVKADAAIAYSKLNLALGVVHGDIAAANKDGEAATPSMRTIGEGAAQAAAGNHAHANMGVITSGSYTGDSSVNRAIPHGLGVTPRLILLSTSLGNSFYAINGTGTWIVCFGGGGTVTTPNDTNFYVGNATNYAWTANLTATGYRWVAIG